MFSEYPVGILPVALRLFEILIVYGNLVPLLMTGSPASSPCCDPNVSQKFLRGSEHIKAWLAGARHTQMLLGRPVGRVPLPTSSHPAWPRLRQMFILTMRSLLGSFRVMLTGLKCSTTVVCLHVVDTPPSLSPERGLPRGPPRSLS